MRVVGLDVRDFRSYEQAHLTLSDGLTVVSGANGAGKTNLLEALYFGCTGRSCRTANEREVVRFGAGTTRVVVSAIAEDGPHELAVGFTPGESKSLRVDGASVERLLDVDERPLISVFLPDRLALVKGPPGLRRAHLDQLVAAMWPARAAARRAYGQTLAQRNALIARIRSGHAQRESLATWDLHLATHGVAVMNDRDAAVSAISESFARFADALGVEDEISLSYRPRSRATDAAALAEELGERTTGDIERGYSTHGPHRDDLVIALGGHDLRSYGSQGQQRLSLLALLLAEREAIAAQRSAFPLMLLDDVMSELDGTRRQGLVGLLAESGGQAVITTTDVEHVPVGDDQDVAYVGVGGGRVLEETIA